MNRFFGGLTNPPQMYAIGALFGLGFDTATEAPSQVIAGTAVAAGLPWYAIFCLLDLCLLALFAAGMSLLDFIIVGMFVVTWSIWRFGRIDERWSPNLGESRTGGSLTWA